MDDAYLHFNQVIAFGLPHQNNQILFAMPAVHSAWQAEC